jgi:hypothetical protein
LVGVYRLYHVSLIISASLYGVSDEIIVGTSERGRLRRVGRRGGFGAFFIDAFVGI